DYAHESFFLTMTHGLNSLSPGETLQSCRTFAQAAQDKPPHDSCPRTTTNGLRHSLEKVPIFLLISASHLGFDLRNIWW
ncbi:hypothetical protein HAX54_028078, partial [Datura stramonium]|nr:hypothetical protein [Datura stramonium]